MYVCVHLSSLNSNVAACYRFNGVHILNVQLTKKRHFGVTENSNHQINYSERSKEDVVSYHPESFFSYVDHDYNFLILFFGTQAEKIFCNFLENNYWKCIQFVHKFSLDSQSNF